MLTKRNVPFLMGILAILITLGVYFLTAGRRDAAIDMWGIGFVLFAELAAVYGLIRLPQQESGEEKTLLFISGGVSLLVVYAGAAVLVSGVFMVFFPAALAVMIAVHVLLMAVVALCLAGLKSVGKDTEEKRKSPALHTDTLQRMIRKVQIMKETAEGKVCRRELNRLYEELRYSDHGTESEIDRRIQKGLSQLEELVAAGEEAAVKEKVAGLLLLVKERKVLVAESKRGKA